jgi:quercetin dioxygenase-like cupin family protein
MSFYKESDLKEKQIAAGLTLRAVAGDHTMLTFVEFQPHAVLPVHQHPQEQITYLLAGELEFTLEGETRILAKGEGVIVRSQARHGAKALNKPVKVLDAWYPLREDYV